jgi:hypothetical protein
MGDAESGLGRRFRPFLNLKHAILFVALCLLMPGCQTGSLQILNFPLISPMIAPDPTREEFYFVVAVRNPSTLPTTTGFRLVVQASISGASCSGGSSSQGLNIYPVPALQPDGAWSPVPHSARIADLAGLQGCSCKKGACGGTMSFILAPSLSREPIFAPNSHLELQWDKSGDLQKLHLEDKSPVHN